MSLVCGERCGEKRRVAPDRVLPADPQVVAGVYRQRRDVLQELLVFDLLLAELVECFQPVGVVLSHHPPGAHLKGREMWRQYNSVVPKCVPPLVERYPARGKQVSGRLADAATGQGTLVGRRLAPLLQVGVLIVLITCVLISALSVYHIPFTTPYLLSHPHLLII